MADYSVPTRQDLRDEYRLFRKRAYKPEIHRKAALRYLVHFHKDAMLSPGIKTNHWSALTNYQSKSTTMSGVNIKKSFRDFLLARQGQRCCYCQRWLVNIAHACPIEHVLPHSRYPQFVVHFFNFGIACFDCNSSKTDACWGAFSFSSTKYPSPDEVKDFYHPRYHKYAEHVNFIRMETNGFSIVSYTGMTDQGRHLCESLLHKVAAKETLTSCIPSIQDFYKAFENLSAGNNKEYKDLSNFRSVLDQVVSERLSP
ncbi:hypothetical protein M2262_003216 [Pseudomonas sp. BIGb0408]|uniref:TIGR02646 family protein n=1 Tax=Phytopseudomonas flavescens TaxID=29435 RepID=A0A7Z0BPM6_9GAMM|nr:hypothetical protein [Pseudomonas sp. BIGb0408]NYH72263.1 hypothetical protein [Pseudomonas flavescens]